MKMDIKADKEEFVSLLRSTGREGIDYVIEDLEKLGFFDAPASAGHHLNTAGGLVRHSLNTYHAALSVFEAMKSLEPSLEHEIKPESIAIAALLHDVCKADIYKRTVKKRRDQLGNWVDSEGYKVSYRNFPMGHGEKSLVWLLCAGLVLEDDEMLAIRWHMGAWGLNMNSLEDTRSYDTARKLYPLVSLIHSADTLAASIMERSAEELDDM
ncbi:MAG: HD domain-containing protein [Muribaculaceae bacterium]|nr:HD domain-containing protein [Muribaculaceae bacterium]